MKKLLVLTAASLLIAGVTFADNGKKKKKCTKGQTCCSKDKAKAEGRSCCKKKTTATAKL